MDISGCGSGIVSGRDNHIVANVQEPSQVDKAEDKMATVG